MAKGEKKFWMASTEKAATQIIEAVNRKAAVVYVSKRWRLIAWLLKILPDFIYRRI